MVTLYVAVCPSKATSVQYETKCESTAMDSSFVKLFFHLFFSYPSVHLYANGALAISLSPLGTICYFHIMQSKLPP